MPAAVRRGLAIVVAAGGSLVAACGSGSGTDTTTPGTPTAPTGPATPPVNAVRNVHDPAIAKDNGYYYVYSTGPGIPVRRSKDLRQWDSVGVVFAAGLPPNASTTVPGVQFPWAPDVSYYDGRWHLYYSLSTFGSQRSAIGLATSPTLDPAASTTVWTDQGVVVQSFPGMSYNAIDPTVSFDTAGNQWLAWGSF
ncbi:MAG TPA: family 43 glycosylhydrolase, partial [Gemmatirosa sp.]